MKKLIVFLLIAAMILSGCGTATVRETEPAVTEAPTEATEIPTEVPAEPVFANHVFTFTGETFPELFRETLPEGYRFADAVAANPDRNNKLQINILTAAGDNTGLAILLNTTDAQASFSKLALTVGTSDEAADLEALLTWYIATFMTGFNSAEQTQLHENFMTAFRNKSEDHILKTTNAHVAMMVLEKESIGEQFYIMLAIN